MRSDFALSLLASASLVAANGIDFSAVYKAKPALTKLRAVSTSTDRAASARSVISRMNAIKPTNLRTTTTTIRTTKSKTTTKPKSKTTTAKSVKKAVKAKTTTAKSVKKAVKAKSTPKIAKKSTKTTIKKQKKSTKPKKSTKAPVFAAKNAKAKFKSKKKRQAQCAPQDILYGYLPSPNNPNAFLVDTFLGNTAGSINPVASYSASFIGAFGSANGDNYIGYYQLASYSLQACADICTGVGPACQSFNIYYERNPIADPHPDSCPNPNAATSVRCALWGGKITAAQAVNVGQWRANFMTVITGSNGYWKNPIPAAISGFNESQALAGFISSSKPALRTSLISAADYAPEACAQACTKFNTDNHAAAKLEGLVTYPACNYFAAALLSANGVVTGTYCSLYSSSDVAASATLFKQTADTGAVYSFSQVYGFGLSIPDTGRVAGTSSTTTTTRSTVPLPTTPPTVASSSTTTTTTLRPATTTIVVSSSTTTTVVSSSTTTTVVSSSTTTTVPRFASTTTSASSSTTTTVASSSAASSESVGDAPTRPIAVASPSPASSSTTTTVASSSTTTTAIASSSTTTTSSRPPSTTTSASSSTTTTVASSSTTTTVASSSAASSSPASSSITSAAVRSSTTTTTVTTTSATVSQASSTNTACAGLANSKGQFSVAGGRTYELRCGNDYNSHDIGNAGAQNITTCAQLCDQKANCNAVAFTSNICYFKDLTGATAAPNVAASVDFFWLPGQPYTPPSPTTTTSAKSTTSTTTSATTSSSPLTCSMHNSTYTPPGTQRVFQVRCGKDSSAPNLSGPRAASYADCMNQCAGVNGCGGAAWSQSAGACYYKNLTSWTSPPHNNTSTDFFFDASMYPGGV